MANDLIVKESEVALIQNKICTMRGIQVMLDHDLAALYGVPVKRLNEQVRRNIERFPEPFMFQLTAAEVENLKSQFATSSDGAGFGNLKSRFATSSWGGVRKPPKVFSEQGVAMFANERGVGEIGAAAL